MTLKPARRWLLWGGGAGLALILCFSLLGGGALAQESDDDEPTRWRSFVERLSDRLGISTETLETAVEETQLEMIDEALAEGRITESQAERMKDRVDDGHGPFMPLRVAGHAKGQAMGHGLFGHGQSLEVVADTLGVTQADLMAELATGATLTEVIESHGATVDEVVAALVEHAQEKLDAAVVAGRITQAQAERLLETLPDRIADHLEDGRFMGPRFW